MAGICRRHFQIHFLVRKYAHFDESVTDVCAFRSSRQQCIMVLMDSLMDCLMDYLMDCLSLLQQSPKRNKQAHTYKNAILYSLVILQWRHNGCDGVSNHQPHRCLLNCLLRHRSKKISKLCVTGLCAGNSSVSGEFPARMASNAEKVSIWWRHHGTRKYGRHLLEFQR